MTPECNCRVHTMVSVDVSEVRAWEKEKKACVIQSLCWEDYKCFSGRGNEIRPSNKGLRCMISESLGRCSKKLDSEDSR